MTPGLGDWRRGARELGPGYTGNTGPAAALARFLAGVQVLVAEATLLEPGARPAHERGSLTAAEAGELAVSAGAETLVLTDMWDELGLADYHVQAAAIFPGQIEMASPGLALSW